MTWQRHQFLTPITKFFAGRGYSTSFLGRLLKGFAAQGFNQSATILLQLLTVPALLHAWGLEKYGSWLLLSVIPTYITLSDMGFAQAAANDMTVRLARNDRDGVRKTFQSILCLCGSLGVLVMFLSGAFAALAPTVGWLKLSQTSATEARMTVALFGIYGGAALLMGVASAAFRSHGRFALMITLNTAARLAEGSVVVVVALLGGGIVGAAASMLAVRLIALTTAFLLLRNHRDSFPLGWRHARWLEVRRLAPSSFSFMAFPIGNALMLQGTLSIIGLFAPASVALFSTARTLVRIGANALGMINHVFLYDYARLLTTDNIRFLSALRLHTGIVGACILVYLPCALWLAPWFYPIWTGHKLHLSEALLVSLVLGSIPEILWAFLQTPLISINAHASVAANYLLGAIGAACLTAAMLHSGVGIWSVSLIQGATFSVLTMFVGTRLIGIVRMRATTERIAAHAA